MKKLLYVLTSLCLLAGLFAGCEKKPLDDPDDPNGGGGTTPTEQTGVISGVVTDKALGGLISMATVELLPTDRKTQTDDLGAFSFSDLVPGTYRLRVSKSGYGTYMSEDIAVKSGQTVYRAVVLEQEQTDLQILDEEGNALSELYLDNVYKGIFRIKNAGSSIVEWEIPKLAEEWLSFSKESGKLAPGASEQIELTIDLGKLSEGENGAVVYVGSTAGTIQLKVRVNITLPKEVMDLVSSMVYVEGGEFEMGATEEQGDDAGDDEKPVRTIKLDGYYIGKYEVTQAQWKVVMGQDARYDYEVGKGDYYPMYYVNWNEAWEFCQKLSEATGKKYVLPTEAQWEYAARGGVHKTQTQFSGSNDLNEVAWHSENTRGTHPIGTKMANALGIYDMSGNVWEWCSDWYMDKYDKNDDYNPYGPISGPGRVVRGGGWYLNAGTVHYRVSGRANRVPVYCAFYVGFRVACIAE